jgi:hypothetical protein
VAEDPARVQDVAFEEVLVDGQPGVLRRRRRYDLILRRKGRRKIV